MCVKREVCAKHNMFKLNTIDCQRLIQEVKTEAVDTMYWAKCISPANIIVHTGSSKPSEQL